MLETLPVSTLVPGFSDLGLSPNVLKALDEIGYENPTPIQARTIPHVLAGRDVVGQAQTGTGKTAAFALPLLSRLDMAQKDPQALVMTPTRELAIQVAEAFQRYAVHVPGFHVLPIYGGQAYDGQLRYLKRGVQVVVGTPGRLADHLRRGTLRLGDLKCVVLDEADEMLRMGFIDEVEWILEQTPSTRQVTLFLGDHAGAHSAHRPTLSQRPRRSHHRAPVHRSRRADPPALLDGERRA
jgi:ATP-dependent RNA helicase DeaD